MADFSHRPGWRLEPDGTWHPPRQGAERSLGRASVQRAGPAAPPRRETEYRVGRILRDGSAGGEMIFSDRRVAGELNGIDHLVVAASGIWVVDAKKRSAMSYRATGPTRSAMRLRCGKQDVTAELDDLLVALDLVAHLVRDPQVSLHPAMAILPEQCNLVTGLRLRRGRTFTHGGVWIGPPRLLAEQIGHEGPLSQDQVVRIGHRLDEALGAT